MAENERPKIGTAVWVRKNKEVLLGVRAKEQGGGTWCPPGGHLEMNESLQECARREVREEAAVEIQNIRFVTFIEDISTDQGTHYITFYFIADWRSGEPVPQLGEFERLEWFNWNDLPEPLFRPAKMFVDSGTNLFD